MNKGFLTICAVALFWCAPASANIVNFGSLSQAGDGSVDLGNKVTEDGFTFTADSTLVVWQNDFAFHPGGGIAATSLVPFFAGAVVDMTAADKSSFGVKSMDFASYGVDRLLGAMDVTVTGKKADDSTVQQVFKIAYAGAKSPELQTVVFSKDFADIVSLGFIQGIFAANAFQFNNINIIGDDAPKVPLPAAGWLLLAGLSAIGVGKKFSRSKNPPNTL